MKGIESMKKLFAVLIAVCLCFLLAACSDNVLPSSSENESESGTKSETESVADAEPSSSIGSLKLEDVTSEYVEPDFKVVSTLAECYDYFETEPSDEVKKENDADGNITSVTVTDSEGITKGTVDIKYNADSIIAAVSLYTNGEAAEKVIFSFYDEDSVNIIAHVDSESQMSIYLYNPDGTFNSYIDNSGFSSILVGAVFEGLAGAGLPS